MATFVLVHGAMHGGWCWRDVRDMLRSRGHEVFTPTLTGQGERAHLIGPGVGVQTHVRDVVSVFEYEDLHDVHLVLHSYAGILAGPIAQATARITSITYLAAFLTEPGECLLDVQPPQTAARYQLACVDGRLPASPAFLEQWGITDERTREWVGPRLTDLPQRCLTDTVDYDPRHLAALRQSYIRHTQPPLPSLELSWQRAVTSGIDTAEISCGHDMMIAAPRQTARLLETMGPQDVLPPVFPASPRIALW